MPARTKPQVEEVQADGALASAIQPVAAGTVLVSLFGDRVYGIGGRVRDAFIGLFHRREVPPPKDLDYVITAATFAEVRDAFERIGAKVDAVGSSPC